jgi:hypothetical protein
LRPPCLAEARNVLTAIDTDEIADSVFVKGKLQDRSVEQVITLPPRRGTDA